MRVSVAGGGLIGLSSALELARRGASVTVCDDGRKGQASWAAAGILGPQSEVHEPSPMLQLCLASFRLYEEWARGLGDTGFRKNGTLHLAFSDAEAEALSAQREWQRAQGLRVLERAHPTAKLSLFFPDEGQVEPRKLLQALRAACAQAGVQFAERTAEQPDLICTGSWSGAPVFPVRGQMLALEVPPPPCVVFGAGGYLVPREGRTLVGATAEQVGFDAGVTPQGREQLEQIARALGSAGPVLDHWAGLRPGTPDGLPLLGRLEGGPALCTGHHRNGVLLAPITARIAAALVLGEAPPLDLTPFHPRRKGIVSSS